MTFAVWFVTILLTLRTSYSITIIHYVACFLAILAIAFTVSIFRDNSFYNIIRDTTYLLKPILGLFAGYQLCKFESKKAFSVIVYTGLIISIIHLSIIAFAFLEYKTLTVNLIRQVGGYFSDYEIYVLLILLFSKEFQLDISKQKIRWFILIVGVSSFLYLARTNFIQFFIIYLALKGYYKLNKRAIRVLLTTTIIILVGYSIVLSINPKRGGKGFEAFLYKVKIAPIEPFKTNINKSNWKDFNDNYRSYENIIAVKQVSNNGYLAIIFGEGLGATLDLGRKVLSNDGEYVRHIPIVHNGYMTVFLKSGIIGVIILLYFLFILFRQKKSITPLNNHINYLLIGTSIFLILSNWVFLGLYLKLDNKSILIGYMIYLKIIIENENNSQKLKSENESN
ncbi:hypothetical protein ACFSX9_07600 [Flavobacterium ardleyense]|uniref:Uncharacterized protein n=1 Tax=Flavobacterium ardleyense TaxID=2038737 RepID=A0ABW5Z6U9_9FLAO